LLGFGCEHIDSATDSRERFLTMTVTSGQVATKAALNGIRQKPGNQIRNIVAVFVRRPRRKRL